MNSKSCVQNTDILLWSSHKWFPGDCFQSRGVHVQNKQ